MKQFAVIGDPIDHSLSPILHQWVYSHLKLDACYTKHQSSSQDLSMIIEKIKNSELSGVNVTIPHKTRILELLDLINPRAKAIGAVNVVSQEKGNIYGNNTDWYGFSLALKKNNIDVKNKTVTVIGAGGVSKAVIFALKHEGVSHINLLNRSFEKICNIDDNLITTHPLRELSSILKDDSILINCTSVGMKAKESPIDSDLITQHQTIIDTIYVPLKTALIRDAENVGARNLNGLDMFIYQGLASIDLWFGEGTTSKVNFEELKRYIESHLC